MSGVIVKKMLTKVIARWMAKGKWARKLIARWKVSASPRLT
ncbi:hypothetical protein PI124_g19073 [Phytophthora idaei]|nr:hypothetical protein PI125_g20007 [Phytophthora idaei]KAG3134953.1 hypothetical protein PI126_g18463 [Phytophthora idaei]KAG3235907.1 hypothetical protein PI124_g19073 [Phytophthora idaei]